MIKNLIGILILFFISCKTEKFISLKFKPYNDKYEYQFKLPKGYKFRRIASDFEYLDEYTYSDSSIFYISTFSNSYNYNDMRTQGSYYDWFNAQNDKDTITLQGTNNNGLYWKDKLYNSGITVGYTKATKLKFVEFNNAILSIKEIN